MQMIHITKATDGSYFIADETAEVPNRTAVFRPTSGGSTEDGCRTALKNFGVPDDLIEQAIQRANEKTDALIKFDAGRWYLA